MVLPRSSCPNRIEDLALASPKVLSALPEMQPRTPLKIGALAKSCVYQKNLDHAKKRLASNRHHLPHALILHLLAWPARDELTALHHQVVVGQLFGEIVVLLDQQNRHAAA